MPSDSTGWIVTDHVPLCGYTLKDSNHQVMCRYLALQPSSVEVQHCAGGSIQMQIISQEIGTGQMPEQETFLVLRQEVCDGMHPSPLTSLTSIPALRQCH